MSPALPTAGDHATGGPAPGRSEAAEADAPPPRWPPDLILLLVIAAVIRIVGLAGPGHTGDLYAFLDWAIRVARDGLGAYYAAGGDSNYPPMLYLLYPLGALLSGNDLEFAIRALSIPFDLALAALLFFAVRAAGTGSTLLRERTALLAAGLYVLNPGVVLTGPAWGQVDGMGALPMVAALIVVARGHVVSAGVLAVLAGLIKPQYGVAGFVLAGLSLFWLRSPGGWRRMLSLVIAAAITFIVVLLPLGLDPPGYLHLMGETFERYRVHSGFAFNPWAMVFGFNRFDGPWFIVGTTAELLAIGGSLWLLRFRRDLVGLLAVGSLIALTLYFVPTRAHERYLYGAIALIAPLAATDRRLLAPFLALSTTFFLTLAYVVANSPYRILLPVQLADFPGWAISLMSAVTTATGAWMAWRLITLLREGEPNVESAGGRSTTTDPPRPG